MRNQSADAKRQGRRFRSQRAYRRWLKRQGGTAVNSDAGHDMRSGLESLEQRVLLSATPVFELSDLLAANGGDGSQGVVINGVSLGDRAGVSVSSAGDINGDGFDDVIIGAFRDAPNGADSGASFVVFGQAGGFSPTLQLSSLNGTNGFKINGITAGDFSGRSVAAAGDVNGDGFDDLLIGAFVASPGGLESGQAYVVYGKAGAFASTLELSSLNGTNGFSIDGLSAGDRLGFSVRGAGDVNGDGIDDFILGASLATPNGTDSGTAYVVFGQTGFGSSFDLSTLTGTNGFVINGVSADDQLGISANAAGDVNGDGIDDVIVGAFRDDPIGAADSGSAFVVFGKTSGFAATLNPATLNGTTGFIINGETSLDNAGRSVSSAGDFNGDGFADVLIGAPVADGSAAGSGSAYVVFGHAGVFASSLNLSTLTGANGFKLNGIDAGDRAGLAVSAAGDVNGDGLDDLLVAADRANPNGTRSGETYLVLGRSSAMPASLNLSALAGADGFKLNGIDSLDSSGTSIREAGDVDGDGFADFIIGAFLADPNGGESGESYLVFGGDFADAVTHLGSASADGLVGTGGADVIVAGRGDDVITGNGGADVIIAGQGDDEIKIADTTFKRIDGGSGTDILLLDGGGLTLDLTSIQDSRLTGIERIDLSGGANTVTLDLQEVLNISDTSNTLTVVRDINGTINIGSGWTQTNTQVINGDQHLTFSQGNATLILILLADIIDPVVTVDPLTTDTRSPELTGTINDLDPATTVQVTVNGTTYPATVNGDGTWTLAAGTITPDLTDGVYEVLAVGTDTAGNLGNDQTFNELIIDNAAPVVTVDTLFTNSDSPELTGTISDIDPNTAISVNVDGNNHLATNNGDGTWTLAAGVINPNLADGVYEVVVTATDTVGHIGTDATTLELSIDATAPVVTINAPGTTDIASPELTGTVVDADTTAAVKVSVDGNIFDAVNNGDNTWTLPAGTITPDLAEGIHVIDVQATDAAGNQGLLPATVNLEIDTVPVVTVNILTTSDSTPQLTGTVVDADTSAAISVTVNGIVYAATNNGDGTWTLANDTITPALADGTYDVSVTATDSGSNVGSDATTNELTIDTTAPVVTVDTLITNDTTPGLSGTVSDAESTVSVTVDSIIYIATNNGDGTWTLADNTITLTLAEGVFDVSVTATNLALVDGSDATTGELTIDLTNPVVTVDSLSTGDTTPELTGTVADLDSAASITVTLSGVAGAFPAVNNGDGTWTLPDNVITTPLAPGMYDVTVTSVDAAGNLGNVTEVAALEVLNAPFTIAVDPLTTSDVTPELTGLINGNSTGVVVVVTVNGTPYAATNNGDGTWTLPDNTIAPTLADGVYDVTAQGTNADPFMISDSTTDELTIDTTAPAVTIDPLVTTDTTPELTGTIDDTTATISVTVNGVVYVATNNGDGTWTLANNTINPALPVATYDVAVSATDAVGNAGADATIDELLIVVPTATTIELSDLLASNGGDGTEGTVFNGVAASDIAGNSASSAGDINGDGFDDLIIGAPGADPVGNNDGSVYIIFGQAGGFPAEFDLSTLNGTNGFRIDALVSGDDLGVSVASAGDVNGDGLDDLVFGASKADPNGNRSGVAYVVYGKSTPFAATLDLTTLNGTNGYRFEGAATLDRTGFSVSGLGDVNGDGLADVIIGSTTGDDGVTIDTGRSYVIFGSTAAMPAVVLAGSLTGANGFIITGSDAGDSAGFSVGSAGDINGDGIADIRIGAPGSTVGADSSAGKTYVVFGQTSGFPADFNLSTINGTNGFVIEGDAADLELGFTGSAIGDFNGDGFGDLLIGAPASADPTSAGNAYVIFGQAAAFPTTITLASLNGTNGFAIQGVDLGDRTGFNVAGVGDVNGDGFDDLVIGVSMAAGGGFQQGEAYLLFGRAGVFSATLDLATLPGNGGMLINGADTLDHAGRYVSAAGDVNGDGYADLLIAARDADVGINGDAGRTFLLYGRDFVGTVTQAGGALNDTLVGTAARDAVISGAGNDTVTGNGGPDVISTGQGDDTLAVSDTTFVRLTGGNGFDTLRLDGAGITLDLTAISDHAIAGIEQIDVRGSGANTLTLDQREVLNLSDTTNTLLVLADPDDTVNIGTGWTASGTELINGKTFDVFTQGNAVLKIFTDADTTAPVVTVDALTTTDTTPELTGTVVDTDPATTVEVTVNGIAYAATNNGDGTWTLADNTITPALADGTYDVTVTATDTGGNIGTDATVNELVINVPLVGDLNGDGFVGIDDLTLVLANWNLNVPPGDPAADPSGDGFVGIDDLSTVLGNWNAGTPPVAPPTAPPVLETSASAPTAPSVQETTTSAPAPQPQTSVSQQQQEVAVQQVVQPAAIDPIVEKISLLDEVTITKPKPARAVQAADRAQMAAGWNWLHDDSRANRGNRGDRGLRTAFGDDGDDGRASDNALDMAQPLPDQSAISRLL